MATLTITIEDETLHSASLRALEQGISIDALLREYLESYAAVGAAHWSQAADEILKLSSQSRSGQGLTPWNRDELHEG